MSLSKTKKIYKRKKKYQIKKKSKKRYQSKKNKSKKRYQNNKRYKTKRYKTKRYKTKRYKRKYRSKILLGGNNPTDIDVLFSIFATPEQQSEVGDVKRSFEEIKSKNPDISAFEIFEKCLNSSDEKCKAVKILRETTIEKIKEDLINGIEQGETLEKIAEQYNIGENDLALIACDEGLGIIELSGLCVLIRKMLNFKHELPIDSKLGNIVKDGIPHDLRDHAITHLAHHIFKNRIEKHANESGYRSNTLVKNLRDKTIEDTEQNREKLEETYLKHLSPSK